MLTKRENLLETIRGGHPDRFVNQFEYMDIVYSHPYDLQDPYPAYGQHNIVNSWGITLSWPEGTPGGFPVHTPDKIVCKDIEEWRDYVKAPAMTFTEEQWEAAIKEAEAIDRREKFVTAFMAPGIFERCHYLMKIEECMTAFYTNPDEMKDMIKYIAEWELKWADQMCEKVRPDCLFHHDDWGTQISTFISPDMFAEFYLDIYKEVYGFYKSHGVDVIVHHSDSYAETLVPYMIEMGIDIWQGVMTTNNIPELIKKYGDQITFQGGINSASVDHPGWTRDEAAGEVRRACTEYGKKAFIPNLSQGGDFSTFEGVYEAVSEEIDKMSQEMFAPV